MSIKDQIRAEIRQRIKKFGKLADAAWGNDDPYSAEINEHIISELQSLIVFTYSLPEQPVTNCNRLVSENKKPVIKKSNALFDKCVENCDHAVMKEVSDNVDKMLGRQPAEGLEEAANKWGLENQEGFCTQSMKVAAFIAGAEWQKERDTKEALESGGSCSQMSYELGRKDMRKEMLEGAVEGEVLYTPYPTICLDDCRDYDIKDRSNVRVIIIKEDEK